MVITLLDYRFEQLYTTVLSRKKMDYIVYLFCSIPYSVFDKPRLFFRPRYNATQNQSSGGAEEEEGGKVRKSLYVQYE